MPSEDAPSVTVVGSCNHDLTMTVERLPKPGETVLGRNFSENLGGKGSNQAIAAARLGAVTTFIGQLGDDRFAQEALGVWADEGVTAHVRRDGHIHTGMAIILLDEEGENAISVAPGANDRLDADDVRERADSIADADVLLSQLETKDEPVVEAGRIAAEHDTTFILNPAPARDLPDELIELVDIMTPNEAEARKLVGADESVSPSAVAAAIRDLGARDVVITLSGAGALVVTDDGETHVERVPVDVVDTTGAGDAFNAALAVALGEGRDLIEATKFANRAGAGACRAYEVVPSLPMREDLPEPKP